MESELKIQVILPKMGWQSLVNGACLDERRKKKVKRKIGFIRCTLRSKKQGNGRTSLCHDIKTEGTKLNEATKGPKIIKQERETKKTRQF